MPTEKPAERVAERVYLVRMQEAAISDLPPCPRCKEPRGYVCRTTPGGWTRKPHKERAELESHDSTRADS